MNDTTKNTHGSTAAKFDTEKVRLDLLPVIPLIGVGKVLTFGAHKYGARNWEKGLDWSRCYGAALRHLLAWWGGETSDPETGYNHLDHALCELMFLREFAETHPELDDRPNNSAIAALKHISEKEQCAPAEAETPKTLLDVVHETMPQISPHGDGCPQFEKFTRAFAEAGYRQPEADGYSCCDAYNLDCEGCWNRPAEKLKPAKPELEVPETAKPAEAPSPDPEQKTWIDCVKEFNKAYDVPTFFTAKSQDEYRDAVNEQIDLIREEIAELISAHRAWQDWGGGNLAQILDAICDSIYVLIGLALKMGMNLDGAFREVHRSNMSKLGEDGKPIKRDDGKVLKGPNFTPPDLNPFI